MNQNLIFVFGSNLAGRHGKGAALKANQKYGAEYGVGEGLTGRSYAIPTKDKLLRPRTLEEIYVSIKKFTQFAAHNADTMVFYLTPIGCGYAGYSVRDIWHLLQKAGVPENVVFSHHWSTDHALV